MNRVLLTGMMIAIGGVAGLTSRSNAQSIVVDEAGYRPEDSKIAFMNAPAGAAFEVRDLGNNKKVFEGVVRPAGHPDPATGDALYVIDFSPVHSQGRFVVWIPGTRIMSAAFSIGADVYASVATAALQSFSFQRCGTAVGDSTPWQHAPCHLGDAVFFNRPQDSKDMTGGWHDAGDYGKFVVTGAESAAFLLYAYEESPSKYRDGQLAIPERRNGVPDLLDEARWELNWLLRMQSDDGGVFHKVSTMQWTGERLPEDDNDRRYIFDISSSATASFSAVTALASRIYEPIDPGFSAKLLNASAAAWRYLETHPNDVPQGGFQNPQGVIGGEYGDPDDSDGRLWAAAELYRITRDRKYHKYFLEHYQKLGGPSGSVSWQDVRNFAYYAYTRLPHGQSDATARAAIVSQLTRLGDWIVNQTRQSSYRCALMPSEYYWGSNSIDLGYAFDLIWAFTTTHKNAYRDAALDQLHYILGRNAFDQTFVTGIGAHPAAHPYHAFSMSLHGREPVPGMVVAGPNSGNKLGGVALSPYPGKCYQDSEKNYFVNEPAINYTAPLVFVAGFFSEERPNRSTPVSVDTGHR